MYADGDDTEDYFMTDKKTAQEAGLLPVLEKISFGQARFGERIFDQQSNAFMKKVMQSNKSEKEKIALLGTHVAGELLTHADMKTTRQTFRLGGVVQKFKGGGEVKASKLSPAQRQYLEREFGTRWPQADNDLLISSLQSAGMPYSDRGNTPTSSTTIPDKIEQGRLTPAQKQHLESEFGMRWPQADSEVLTNSLQQAGIPYTLPAQEPKKSKKPLGEDLWAGISQPLRALGLIGETTPSTPPVNPKAKKEELPPIVKPQNAPPCSVTVSSRQFTVGSGRWAVSSR